MVAPRMPSSFLKFGSRLLITNCDLPSSSSTASAKRVSPASHTTASGRLLSGSGGTPSSSAARSRASVLPRTCITSPRPGSRVTGFFFSGSVSITWLRGITHVASPTRSAMPSRIASVSGNVRRNRVPRPRVVLMLTSPLRLLTARLTTSMPTPRPERSVTCSAVEKPGAKISSWISSGRSFASGETSPRSMARFKMRVSSRPAPSSAISMITLPPWWRAVSDTRPTRALPVRSRASVGSRP